MTNLLAFPSAPRAPIAQELSRGVDTDATEFGAVFLSRGLPYLVGTLFFGKAVSTFNNHGHRVLASSLVGCGISCVLIPIVTSFPAVCLAYVGMGFFSSANDTLCQAFLTWLHGPHVAPWMQVRTACVVGRLCVRV